MMTYIPDVQVQMARLESLKLNRNVQVHTSDMSNHVPSSSVSKLDGKYAMERPDGKYEVVIVL
jgi:hypothetical protein